MDLYGIDLSLFGGDLLVGLSSPADSDTSLPFLVQDDYQLDILKPQAAAAAGELSAESGIQLTTPAVSELLDNQWLDENTDLLDLLEDKVDSDGDNFLPSHVSSSGLELVSLGTAHHPEQSKALQILQSLADENGRELASSPPLTCHNLVCPPAKPSVSGSSVLMGMLLDGVNKPTAGLDITKDNCMDVDVDDQLVLEASLAPILSPVSPDEVESLLSSGPCSPSSAANLTELVPAIASQSFDSSSDVFEDSDGSDETWLPSPPPRPKSRCVAPRSAPYSKPKLSKEAKQMERKQRKKQQNRDAALRYRQKKKQEVESVSSVCDKLEKRNRELKDKADQLSREIQYLKDLMADVYRAKGLVSPKK